MTRIRFDSGPARGEEHTLADAPLWIVRGRVQSQPPPAGEPGIELRPEAGGILLLSRAEAVEVGGERFRRRRLAGGDAVSFDGGSFEVIAGAAPITREPYESSEESLGDLSRHPASASRLALLYEFGTALADFANFYVGLDRITRRLAEHLGCRRAFLIEERDGRRVPSYDFKSESATMAGQPPFDPAIVESVFATRRATLEPGPPSRAAAPVLAGRSVAAVLHVESLPGRELEAGDLDFLRAVALSLSLSLANYRLHQLNCEARLELEAKNREIEDLCRRLRRDLDERDRELARARDELRGRADAVRPVAASPRMAAVLETIERVADTPFPILLLGETGAGKEVLARWLHARSGRRDQPFVAENCAAISESVLEAELFGYEKGAFTGATERRAGLFEAAHGGTLFLDEIGEMDLANQAKLLRVCQEGVVRRVGSSEATRVDVRLVWATNRDLESMVAQGRFREDLFYRLNAITVTIPPLRERLEDIPLLVERFLEKHRAGDAVRRFTPAALARLAAYPWPGNVRELENEVARALALGAGGDVGAEDLSERVRSGRAERSGLDYEGGPLSEHLERVEREVILAAYRRHAGNKVQAARELAIDRGTLAKRLKAFGVED